MASSRKLCKNKTYIDHNSINGLFLIVYTIALMFPMDGSTLDMESNEIRCSDSMTCAKCAIKPNCVWPLERQVCENYLDPALDSSRYIVSMIHDCPQFSVVKEYQYMDSETNVTYVVRITNDIGMHYLQQLTDIYYNIPYLNLYEPVMIVNETDILFSFQVSNEKTPLTFFWYISFNTNMLWFDNVSDNYDTVYGYLECAIDDKYACATCGWNTNGDLNYLQWCSSKNTCKGNRNVYMKNQFKKKVAYVTNDCDEINVTAVNPLCGPETGGTTVTITVRNHMIFIESGSLKVMVAGALCTDPETSGPETLTCTTSQTNKTLSGPILIEYSSIENVLKIESSQIFQFCLNPVLDADQQLEAVMSGGTSVPILGSHFVEPCIVSFAQLYVELPDGDKRYADSNCDPPVNDTYMVCRSPRLDEVFHWNDSDVRFSLNFGLDIAFSKADCSVNQTEIISVSGPSFRFHVNLDPVFENFIIDEANSLVINGLNLKNIRLEDIVVRFHNSSATGCLEVSVESKRIVCYPTTSITPIMVHEILVEIGEYLSYTLRRSPTAIVDPFNFPVHNYPSILPSSNKTSCLDSMTCIKCTINPLCAWSFDQQACEYLAHYIGLRLRAYEIEDCPRFSVIKEYDYGESNVTLKYTVKLSNYSNLFKSYLNGITLYNRFPTYCKYPTKQYNENREMIISCEFYVKKSIFDQNNPSFTFFTFISFKGVMLRFDNISDHYVSFYKQKECANDEKRKSCVTCAWNDDGYLNYLRWCSPKHTCQGNRNIYMKNNGKEQLNFQLAYLTNECVEINVAAVDPLSGPETGGTTVMITVRNHGILAENRNVMVTIAQTVCLNPRTSGLETITCTTSQSVGTPSGPILVEYSSTENVLKIESSQIFQFCPNPVLDVDQQLHGILSGGTSVPIWGDHFVEHSITFLSRLYVDLPDGVRRYADSICDPPVNDTYMVCRSPRVNGVGSDGDSLIVRRSLNFGLDISFSKDVFSMNQMLPIAVRGPSLRYYVHPDPVLLDFEIDKSGSVTITGHNLQHVWPKDIVIRFIDSQSLCCLVVSITQHSLVCEPTKFGIEPQVISVTLGTSLVFTVVRRSSTQPDDPPIFRGWFFTIMSTVLLFVGAFTCRQKMKHQYNRIVTRSEELDVNTAL